jgi:serine/threonine-protein kinase
VQGRLEHPAVVPVYDLGADATGPYFTMRRVRGVTLAHVLKELAVQAPGVAAVYTRRKLLTAMASVCLAVHYAHTRGVLHRDLKPANIMLGDFGEVYVIDWGIAKQLPTAPALDVSATGETTESNDLVGTAGYMAPEQFAGRGDVLDARTDVYSLGAILFEVLALHPLLKDASVHTALLASIDGLDARASRYMPDVPPELDAICTHALALHPPERFQTAKDMATAIEHFLDGDRDLAMRQKLATEQAAAARRAAVSAHGDPNARVAAMRRVVSALALDPDEPAARKLLVELLTRVPDALPAAVAARIEAANTASRLRAARVGAWALLSWLGVIPMVYIAGVAHWSAVIPTLVLTVLAALWAGWAARTGRAGLRESLVLAVLVFSAVGGLSVWLGPFVLVPVASATVTLWFALHAAGRERAVVIALGILAVLVPFTLELLHLVPAAYEFRNGDLVLHPRALRLPPGVTQAGLVYTSVGFSLLPAVFLGRLRDALGRAEAKVFLQAWQLEQLVSEQGVRKAMHMGAGEPPPAARAASQHGGA